MAVNEEDVTTFESQYNPKDDKPTAERRAHTWKERERMSWVATVVLAATMLLPYWPMLVQGKDLGEITARIVENGQWVFGIVLLVFIGGKATVEALVSLKTSPRA